MMHNPEMNQAQPIPHIPPGVAKCTLDVRLSPDGSGQAQSAHSLWKAHAGVLWKIHEYFPISHGQMVGSGVRSSIMYPFVNVFYSNREIQPIISILP